MPNAVDDFLEAKKEAAQTKLADEQKLFSAWKEDPNKRTLGALLTHFKPEIDKRVQVFKAPRVDTAAFKAELHRNAIQAFESYDPNRGAALKTHLTNILKRSQRFNAKHQNVAYIPEEMSALITPIQKARDFLFQEAGSAPDHSDISDYLNDNPGLVRNRRLAGNMTPALVKRVDEYQISDISSTGFASDPYSKTPSPHVETLSLLRTVLKPSEVTVFDYMMGHNGNPKITSTGEIARKLGKSDSQISRIKKSIEAQMKKHM